MPVKRKAYALERTKEAWFIRYRTDFMLWLRLVYSQGWRAQKIAGELSVVIGSRVSVSTVRGWINRELEENA